MYCYLGGYLNLSVMLLVLGSCSIGVDMGLIPVRYKKPRRYVPPLIGPQIPRTDLLTVATKVNVVTVKLGSLPGIQFYSFAIDNGYGIQKSAPRSKKSTKKNKLVIDWDNLKE